jgi:hypothetical protein
MHFYPGIIIQESRKHQKEKKTVIPTGVKEITRHKQQDILVPQFFIEHKPIQNKDNRKKKSEIDRIKQHGWQILLSVFSS